MVIKMSDMILGAAKAVVQPVQSLVVDRITDSVKSIWSYDDNVNGLVAELDTLCVIKQDIDAEVIEGNERLQVLTGESAQWLKRLNELIMREEMKELMKEHRVAIIMVKMMEQRVIKKLLNDSREVFDIVVEVVMNKCNQVAGEEIVDDVEDADYNKVAGIAMEVIRDTTEEFKKFMMIGEAAAVAVELLNDGDFVNLGVDGDELARILSEAEGTRRIELELSDQDEVAMNVEPVNKDTIKEKVAIWRKCMGSLMAFLNDENFKKGMPHSAKFRLEVMEALSKKVGVESIEDNPEEMYCGWCIVRFEGYRYCHDMSKRAEVMGKVVRSMIDGCRQGCIMRPKRAHELEDISNEFMEGLESREELLHKILTAFNSAQVNVVGVIGMGGSGKTTLAKEVAEKRASLLFDKRVWVEVSEVPNIQGIQDQIAEGLNMKLDDVYTVAQRARKIYNVLKLEKKSKILIILDNVWTKLKLNEVGIPLESNEDFCCKLLITTRDKQVCRSMDVQVANIFEVGILNKKEAMNLFENQIGMKVVNAEYKPLVDRLLRKCGGLPLAIVAAGDALRSRDLPLRFQSVEESDKLVSSHASSETYSILEKSCRLMDIEEKRIFFFLACLSPLDSALSIDDLIRYGIGLDLFQRANKLSEAMNQASGWLNELVSSSLLLKDDSDGQVKIHDLVRASTISFAEKGMDQMTLIDSVPRWVSNETFEKLSAISLLSGHDFSRLSGVKAPLLEILLLNGNVCSTTLAFNFFEGMPKLKVLSLSNMDFTLGLPESMGQLEQLKTLHLQRCKLKDIKLLGKLASLLVLSLHKSSLEGLGDELGELSNLRLLDMGGCKGVSSLFLDNILSRLSILEGLYVLNTFDIGDNDGGSHNKISVSALNKVSHLSVLEMEVQTPNQLHTLNNRQLFEQLDKFRIYVGDNKFNMDKIQGFHRVLELFRIDLRNQNMGLRALLPKCDFLRLEDCGGLMENFVLHLDEEGFKDLKYLEVIDCYVVNFIVSSNMLNESAAFVNLEHLKLTNMSRIEVICNGKAPAGLFSNLQCLTLYSLGSLMYALPLTRVQLNLVNLTISYCESLKFIFIEDVSIPNEKAVAKKEAYIVLPFLKSIALEKVENLSSVLGRAETIDGNTQARRAFFHEKIIFPSLESLKLSHGGKFATLWSKEFHSPSFRSLKIMHIFNCTELRSLGPPYIFDALGLLEELSIGHCENLQEVITVETRVHEVLEHVISFPLLKFLSMTSLPIIERFYGGSYNLEFPKLKSLILTDTPSLTNFLRSENSTALFLDKIKLPCLEDLKVVGIASEVARLWNWSSIGVQGENGSSSNSWNPIPNLQKLCLGEIHGLMSIPPIVSHNLSHLVVTDFDDIQTLISICSENREAFLTYSQLPKLENLSVEDCRLLENLFESEDDAAAIISCGQLTGLILRNLPVLKMIPVHLFKSLVSISLNNLHGLKYAFSADLFIKGRQQLQLLEVIEIAECENMEVIIMDEVEEGGEDKDYGFPRLKSFILVDLINVTNFASNPSAGLYFPYLESVLLKSCDNIQLFCSGNFRAPKLNQVELENCKHLKCFLSEITDGFQQLPFIESVHIRDCPELLSFSFKPLAAPKLQTVRLQDCFKIKWFSPGSPNLSDILELPSLESVYILNCNLMRSFLPGQFKLPGLSKLEINLVDCSMRSNEELEYILGTLNIWLLRYPHTLIDTEEKWIFFFLACLSPLDSALSIDDLIRYGIGLDLFQRANKLSEAMNQASGWVNELVLSSLLLNKPSTASRPLIYSDGQRLKVHDVARASAISFAEKDMDQAILIDSILGWVSNETFEKLTAISLLCGHDFSRLSGVKAPLLEILLLKGNISSTTLASNFFEGMTKLKVLSLSDMNFKLGLPESMGQLEHLKTLHLECCKLKDIKLLGKLVNLLVLSLRESSLEELSDELGELSNLLLLDVGSCKGLSSVFMDNFLSRLSCLEGLYLLNTYDGGSNNKISVSALNKDSHLSVLEMAVDTDNQLQTLNDAQFIEQLDKYRIYVGRQDFYLYGNQWFHRVLELFGIDLSNQNMGLRALLPKCDFLRLNECEGLKENFVLQLDEEGFKELKYLDVRNCKNVNFIVSSNMLNESAAFVNLEFLRLTHMSSVEVICDGKAPAGLFSNLQCLTLYSLGSLMYALPLTHVQLNLVELSISYCESLKFIFIEDVSIPTEKAVAKKETYIVLPFLKSIALEKVENLSSVLGRAETIDDNTQARLAFFHEKIIFPSLESLKLSHGGKFATLWSKEFHSPSFRSLKIMHIFNCTELRSLGPPYIFDALGLLEELSIGHCENLQEVITVETRVHEVLEHVISFPLLKFLSMTSLPIIERFYGGSYNLEFPKLKSLILTDTPSLTNFLGSENSTALFLDKIKLPCLEDLKVVGIASEVARLWNWSSIGVQGENGSSSNSWNPIPNLQKLCLGEIHGLMSIPPIVSHNLSHLVVTDFDDIQTLISICSENREAFLTYSQLPKLENLSVEDCRLLENLFESEDDAAAIISCGQLTGLILRNLPVLKMIPVDLFKSLVSISLNNLHGLKYAFSADLFIKGRQQLQLLEVIEIAECENMEVIIMDEVEEGGEDKDYGFPRLKSFILVDLINVTNFASNPSAGLYFPYLESVLLKSCDNIQLFCSGNFRAPKLNQVELENCKHLKCFLSEITDGFQQLPFIESVHIRDCPELLSFSFKPLAAPKLQTVRLQDCFKIKWFSPGSPNLSDILELPSLESVYILNCNLMRSFLPGQFKLPGLSKLEINLVDCSMRSNEELEYILGTLNIWLLRYPHTLIDTEEKWIFFFLACLFPRGSTVLVDEVMRYAIGLDLFQHANNLSEAMNQASGWVNELVLSSLLIKKPSYATKRRLKVDDVARASAISFAKEEMDQVILIDSIPRWVSNETFEKFTAISLLCGHDFSRLSGVKAPLLEILLLNSNISSTTLASNFFEGMTKLKVLSLSDMNFELGLPESMGQLEHLKTLHLERCKLNDIKLLGKLVNLLVLSLRESSLEELSDELGELSNLRLLDLGYCEGLSGIFMDNILSRLSCLEGLYLLSTFDGGSYNKIWVSTLNKFSHLSVLEMAVKTHYELQTLNDAQFIEQLGKYRIYAGSETSYMDKIQVYAGSETSYMDKIHGFHRVLELYKINWGLKGSKALLQKCDFLRVYRCEGIHNFVLHLDEEGFKELKYLEVTDCNNVKFIVSSNMLNESAAFVNLEVLILARMSSVKVICDGKAPAGLFSNLQCLSLDSLGSLMYALPLTHVQLNLVKLSVTYCESLEFIFIEDVSIPFEKALMERETCIVLPLLKSIVLGGVENLLSVLRLEETIDDNTQVRRAFFHEKVIFPSLERFVLSTGGKSATLWSKACHSQSFRNLKFMHILRCPELQSLGPPSVFAALGLLEELRIEYCKKLQEVITVETEVHEVPEHVIKFPSLKILHLEFLPIFERFYGGSYNLKFPKLRPLALLETPESINELLRNELLRRARELRLEWGL